MLTIYRKFKAWLRNHIIGISFLIIIFTIALTIVLWQQVNHYWVTLLTEDPKGHSVNDTFNPISAYGSIVSAIATVLIGTINVILLIRTISLQREHFFYEKSENRIFELLKIHRENAANVTLTIVHDNNKEKTEKIQGYRVFIQLKNEFIFCNYHVEQYTKQHQEISLLQIDILGIAYLYFYFGIDREYKGYMAKDEDTRNDDAYDNVFNNIHIHSPLYSQLYDLIKNRLVQEGAQEFSTTNNSQIQSFLRGLLEEMISHRFIYARHFLNEYNKVFGETQTNCIINERSPLSQTYLYGMKDSLGLYYRHLFQTVRYVNTLGIPYNKQYQYIKILRAQLSDAEQTLLLWNSLSPLGQEWELRYRNKTGYTVVKRNDADTNDYDENCLITKYNLIANIAGYGNQSEQVQTRWETYYPLVRYEHDPEGIPSKRNELENQFKLWTAIRETSSDFDLT
ncbi:MAG: hypothetical protein JNJ85_05295 [Candidatus Kapabacteria bacterium]|nr:hypothetical protein [Candidatus Kapabacteria bacterium]MBX7154320.1 putative phage abortive infection protein [Bacteroidota bacterium]